MPVCGNATKKVRLANRNHGQTLTAKQLARHGACSALQTSQLQVAGTQHQLWFSGRVGTG